MEVPCCLQNAVLHMHTTCKCEVTLNLVQVVCELLVVNEALSVWLAGRIFLGISSADGKKETFLKKKPLKTLSPFSDSHSTFLCSPVWSQQCIIAHENSAKYSLHPAYSSAPWHPFLLPLNGDFKSVLPVKYFFRVTQDYRCNTVPLQCSPGAHSGASALLRISEIACDFMMWQLQEKMVR